MDATLFSVSPDRTWYGIHPAGGGQFVGGGGSVAVLVDGSGVAVSPVGVKANQVGVKVGSRALVGGTVAVENEGSVGTNPPSAMDKEKLPMFGLTSFHPRPSV